MAEDLRKLELLDHFKLRVPEIDGEHQIMLDLIKAVLAAASARDKVRCEGYLDRLFAFAESHFKHEEALLKEWGFPDVDTHMAYHAELLDGAASLRKVCAGNGSQAEFEACCEKMMSFLVDDMVRGDIKLKSFCEKEGLSLPA